MLVIQQGKQGSLYQILKSSDKPHAGFRLLSCFAFASLISFSLTYQKFNKSTLVLRYGYTIFLLDRNWVLHYLCNFFVEVI